ncbi:MAG: hypothetical protein K8R34_07595, partial [Methanosarcinales archaeon]|nr:hypothetical protein [Methanosarcinales archaeon]MCD4809984.1 hypothetical protein [Methanosarcinales archaeon]
NNDNLSCPKNSWSNNKKRLCRGYFHYLSMSFEEFHARFLDRLSVVATIDLHPEGAFLLK